MIQRASVGRVAAAAVADPKAYFSDSKGAAFRCVAASAPIKHEPSGENAFEQLDVIARKDVIGALWKVWRFLRRVAYVRADMDIGPPIAVLRPRTPLG